MRLQKHALYALSARKLDPREIKYLGTCVLEMEEPVNFKEAVESKFRDEWYAAMNLEIESQEDHETHEFVSLDNVPDVKIGNSMWVYKLKVDYVTGG